MNRSTRDIRQNVGVQARPRATTTPARNANPVVRPTPPPTSGARQMASPAPRPVMGSAQPLAPANSGAMQMGPNTMRNVAPQVAQPAAAPTAAAVHAGNTAINATPLQARNGVPVVQGAAGPVPMRPGVIR